MGFHPVQVALQRVDLAVVGQHAERLGQPPLGESVGGIALVINGKRGFEPVVHQIRVKFSNLLGQHHAFVNDGPARQRRDVKRTNTPGQCRFFNAAADDIQLAFKGVFVDAFCVRDQDLFDLGAGRVGLFAKAFNFDRHMAPAVNIVAHAQNFGFHDGPAGFLGCEIGAGQEHLTHRNQLVHVRRVAGALNLVIKELYRDLHMDARTITGLAIRVHSTPVPDGFQGLNAIFNHGAAGRAINGHNQTNTARRMLFFLGIETIFGHKRAFGFLGFHPVFIIFGHGFGPFDGSDRNAISSEHP